MILLNVFYKGLAGAMGALLCYLLYLVFRYEIGLIKKYWTFLRSHDTNDMKVWEVILFCIINFVFIWVISFGLLFSLFDWRTLPAEYCVVLALVISILINGVIAYIYYFKLSKVNKENKVRQTPSNISVSPTLPDAKINIVKFNYFYSFEFIPQRIQDYTEHKIAFEDVISPNTLPTEFLEYVSKITITSSGLNNDDDVQLTLIEIPSTKAISEVSMLLIIRSIKHNVNRLYSLEYSIDDYCVCNVTVKTHNNLGFETSDGNEFLAFCLADFRKYLPKDDIHSNELDTVKEVDSINYEKSPSQLNPLDEFVDSTTTDIYGTNLTNRIKDIFEVIKEGADYMIKQLIEMPIVSEQGRMETEIIMASILANKIDTGILIQSLLTGNPLYNNIGITTLASKVDNYKSLYNQLVKRSFVQMSWPLLDFARQTGTLKIVDFKIDDRYGHSKCPVFVKADGSFILCHFDIAFEPGDITPEFVSYQKYNIIVEKRDKGDLVFIQKSDIQHLQDSYFDLLGYNIYIMPLANNNTNLSEKEITIALNTNGVSLSSVNPIIGYAFSEGKRSVETIASSIGII